MKFSINVGLFALATSVVAINDLGLDIDLSKADHTCENGRLKCCGVFDYASKFTGHDLEWLEKIVGSPLQTELDLDPSDLGAGTFGNCVDLPLLGDGSLIFEGGLLKTECPDTVACCHEGGGTSSGPDGLLGVLVQTTEDLGEHLAFLNPGNV